MMLLYSTVSCHLPGVPPSKTCRLCLAWTVAFSTYNGPFFLPLWQSTATYLDFVVTQYCSYSEITNSEFLLSDHNAYISNLLTKLLPPLWNSRHKGKGNVCVLQAGSVPERGIRHEQSMLISFSQTHQSWWKPRNVTLEIMWHSLPSAQLPGLVILAFL